MNRRTEFDHRRFLVYSVTAIPANILVGLGGCLLIGGWYYTGGVPLDWWLVLASDWFKLKMASTYFDFD